MMTIAFFYLLLLGCVLAIPILAISAFIRVRRVQENLNLLQKELDILRLSPGSGTSEEILARVRTLEERLDHLRGVLRIGAETMRGETPETPLRPPSPAAADIPRATQQAEDLSIDLSPAPVPPPLGSSPVFAAPPPIPEPVSDAWAEKTPLPVNPSLPPIRPEAPAIDWEKFTAIKLFSWIGGFALFLGAVFFVKYSIDNGWVSPSMRVLAGLVTGAGVLIAGLTAFRRGYAVTGQTLAAAACAILYADAFAAHALYGLLNGGMAFAFMSLVTVLAFALAVRLDSQYVALLGLVGGFLAPPLLSTGVDRALGLFSYITLLDLGLFFVAVRKRWMFLISLGAMGTLFLQIGWAEKFFFSDKMPIAAGIYLWFAALFAAAHLWAIKDQEGDPHSLHTAGVMSLAAVVFAMFTLNNNTVAGQPAIPFALLIIADGLLAFLALRRKTFQAYHLAAGAVVFLALLGWTERFLTPALLPHALAVYLILGVLHGAFAVVLHRRGGTPLFVALGQLYPVILLLPLILALTRQLASPAFLWPMVFLLNGVAILAALATGFLWALLIALVFSVLATSLWLPHVSLGGLPGLLAVIAGVGALFYAAGLWVMKRKEKEPTAEKTVPWAMPPVVAEVIPTLGCLLPFLLLGQAAIHLKLADPAPVFGLGALFAVLLLGLSQGRFSHAGILAPVALASMTLLQYVWHGALFDPQNPLVAAPWYLGTLAVFWALPFFFKSFAASFEHWLASAAAGPLLFYLLHKVDLAIFGPALSGVLPAGLAVIYTGSLAELLRQAPESLPRRQTLLAMFGGVALLFVSLIFPLQFDREWITLGWALEGLALVWLNRRVPHPGLKFWAAALLGIAFVRLAVNPAVLSYHARSGTPLINWYLYAYGITAACTFLSARLWRPESSEKKVWGLDDSSIPRWLNALGGVLLFLLLNIQIADYFSTGSTLTFNLRGSLAQDMGYTLGWGLFGLAVLLVGLWSDSKGARRAAFGLLSVTIGKLFLHDVWRLPLLYRAAAFVGLAVVLIVSSFLFQRFLRNKPEVRQ